jgi:2'-5' RNA ligase
MEGIVPVSEYWEHLERTRESPFIGIVARIPPRLWPTVKRVQDELKKVDPAQLYTPSEFLHISIKGLGFIGEKLTELKHQRIFNEIEVILKDLQPFDISISGLDYFPTSIYAKVIDPYDYFKEINYRLSDKLSGLVEESQYDRENYIPHVRIATFTTKNVLNLLEKVKSLEDYDFGSTVIFEVEAVSVNLYATMAFPGERGRAFRTVRVFHIGK